jgi:hypothetical protein
MLKQSLIQEKLSDLTGTSSSAAKPEKSDSENSNTNNEILLPHMPQWQRVQLNNKQMLTKMKNIKINNLTVYSAQTASNTSNTSVANNLSIKNIATPNEYNDEESSGNIDYDGNETVIVFNTMHNSTQPNENFNKNFNYSGQQQNNNNNNTNELNLINNSTHTNNSSNEQQINRRCHDDELNSYIMKLRYLEKSIKFIQQQHGETLNGLHQEIDQLKSENRSNLFDSLMKQIYSI